MENKINKSSTAINFCASNEEKLNNFIYYEAEDILKKFKEAKSVDEGKLYLIEKLKKYFSKQNLNLDQNYCNAEVNQQLDNLIADNKELKKTILFLYKKCNVNFFI